MNELAELIKNAKSNLIVLEKNKIYHISPEDSFHFFDMYCSNTAFESENPNGERYAGIYIKRKKHVVIDGNNAKIVIHGIMTPIVLSKVKSITLKNLTIDYARPTMSEFEIIKSEPGLIRIRIPDIFPYKVESNTLYWLGEKSRNGEEYFCYPYKGDNMLSQLFDIKTKMLEMLGRNEGDKMPSVPTIEKITEVEKGLLEISFSDKKALLPVNSIVQSRDVSRKQIGGIFDECENLRLHNVEINAMNGMGLVFQNCKNITLDDVRCVPGQNRTITCNADFFHFSGCMGRIVVKNCKAIGAHDDVINVHGTHLKVMSLDKEERSILVRFCHPASWGFDVYKKGDKIEFVKNETLIPYAKNIVDKVELVDKHNVKLYLRKELPDINLGKDVVENVTRTASLVVKNNYFERISSRAILCTTRKKVTIKNNIFKSMCGPVLYVADDCNFWFESGRSGIVKFISNEVDCCDYGFTGKGENLIQYEPIVLDKTSQTPVHKKVVIKNNRFRNSVKDKYSFKFEFLSKAAIKNNLFDKKYEVIKDKLLSVNDTGNKVI